MITESGEVIRVDQDSLWIRTIRSSTCHACQAKHGCGQKLLNRVQADTADIKASLRASFDRSSISEGDRVEIGIDQNAVVISSLMLYGLPLVTMMLVIWSFEGLISDYFQAFMGFASLLFSGLLIRTMLKKHLSIERFQPWVIRKLP